MLSYFKKSTKQEESLQTLTHVNSDQFENSKPLSLNLNGNKLIYIKGKKWISESSDLETAANEIHIVLNEREDLLLQLEKSQSLIEDLKNEIIETNEMKTLALNMVRYI
jgi:hypothetical protein